MTSSTSKIVLSDEAKKGLLYAIGELHRSMNSLAVLKAIDGDKAAKAKSLLGKAHRLLTKGEFDASAASTVSTLCRELSCLLLTASGKAPATMLRELVFEQMANACLTFGLLEGLSEKPKSGASSESPKTVRKAAAQTAPAKPEAKSATTATKPSSKSGGAAASKPPADTDTDDELMLAPVDDTEAAAIGEPGESSSLADAIAEADAKTGSSETSAAVDAVEDAFNSGGDVSSAVAKLGEMVLGDKKDEDDEIDFSPSDSSVDLDFVGDLKASPADTSIDLDVAEDDKNSEKKK